MYRTIIAAVFSDGSKEDFDSLPQDTQAQALETAYNLMQARLEDEPSLQVTDFVGVTRHHFTVQYQGTDRRNRRTYIVDLGGGDVAFVIDTASDEDLWQYECASCQKTDCRHIEQVMQARAEFEAADDLMGDATP